jgi:hypothetical protein
VGDIIAYPGTAAPDATAVSGNHARTFWRSPRHIRRAECDLDAVVTPEQLAICGVEIAAPVPGASQGGVDD